MLYFNITSFMQKIFDIPKKFHFEGNFLEETIICFLFLILYISINNSLEINNIN